jgi:hypothetical protein
MTVSFLDKVAVHESKYDGNIQGSENVILSLPNTTSTPVTTPLNVRNFDSTYDVDITTNLVLPNISFTDSDGTITSVPSVTDIVATPQVKDIFIKGIFAIGNDTMETLTIDSDTAGTFTSITDDGSSGSITLSKNGSAFSAFSSPLVLASTDTLVVKRTVTSAVGNFKLIGNYV